MNRIRGLLPILAALVGACAATPPAPAPPQQPPLLPPASLGAPHQADQIMRAAFGNREVVLHCLLRASPAQIQVLGLDAVGQRVFSVSWDGKAWTVQTPPTAPSSLRPESLVADVQLALWPLPVLQAAYAPAHWELTETAGGTRRLRQNGRLIAEVHYADHDPWNGRYWIVNFRYSYALEIEPAPAATEP